MSKYNEKTTVQELVSDYANIIKGKTVLTTGVTPGSLGYVFVEAVAAASPALLILAGRDEAKLAKAAESIAAAHPGAQTRNLVVDLCSLASVRKAAEEVNSWTDVPKIDVVVNNAGIMAVNFALTPDGFETQFAASHIGHFLLTNLIMSKVLASESPRIVNISSDGHRFSPIRWADPHYHVRSKTHPLPLPLPFLSSPRMNGFAPANIHTQNGETYQKWIAYGQAKTANMLFSLSLAEKLGKRGLLSYSLHPGVIFTTGLGAHLDNSENGDVKLLRKNSPTYKHTPIKCLISELCSNEKVNTMT